jgi:hypothetical protein
MGMATVSYGRDPRDPWDEGSYFGEGTEWPVVAQSEAGADTATGSPEDTADKSGAVAQLAKQGASAVQSLKQGGAQALLAQAGQAAVAHVAGKLPGGVAAIGLPGSLPRIGADVVTAALRLGDKQRKRSARRRADLECEISYGFKGSTWMTRQGCITTDTGITIPIRQGILRKTLLGFVAVRIFMYTRLVQLAG